ncbi:response regulator transcription factor [Roseospirillum parvum]|uniref:DNA-binding response regulator, NarL/FixJ family, contains REC and HTH domains n=1 Tax=Roseospirillum parvum TaxID=83401 RepID=A0A1G8E985_9PROT|nr:response regulator transcription factor [Roseospirillum parvum]SDH66239.1 DNA-binding response regulator, NarL/FixJ family, contains REC and HTH domains [Roseospirillum parvum]
MRVLLADDHHLVQHGMRPFLEELEPGTEVLVAADFAGAMAGLKEQGPCDLAVLDLNMPGMEGGDAIRQMMTAHPEMPVVVLSGSVDPEDILHCYRLDAAAYLPKTMSGPAMLAVLRLVLTGERFFPAFMLEAPARPLVKGRPGGEATRATLSAGGEPGGEGPLARLSVREAEILGLIIDGGTNKEIARRLEVQEITVKVHLRNVYRKLGAANRAQAVRIALEHGWLERNAS